MSMRIASQVAALVLAAAFAGPATAVLITGNMMQDVRSVLSGSENVNVTVRDGVATVTGHIDNKRTFNVIRHTLLHYDNVTQVLDRTITTH